MLKKKSDAFFFTNKEQAGTLRMAGPDLLRQ